MTPRFLRRLSASKYRYAAILSLLVLAIFLSVGPAASYGGMRRAPIPTFSIESVVPNETVNIRTYNFPANQEFVVTMGPMGSRGINGTVIGRINSGQGGSFTATFPIPEEFQGDYQVAIRLQTEHRRPYFAYNWFYNDTSGPGTGGPGPGPVQPQPIPTIHITSVVRDESVTFETRNYPANKDFRVTMGRFGSRGIGGIEVGTFNSGAGGTLQQTFPIPEQLQGQYRIAIRAQSNDMNPYYSYNWFYNNTADVGTTSMATTTAQAEAETTAGAETTTTEEAAAPTATPESSAAQDQQGTGGAEEGQEAAAGEALPTIADLVQGDSSFETLLAALDAANLTNTFANPDFGPFTVFAPTDAAFAALPEGTLDTLLADPSGQLTDVLLYHVVEGEVTADALANMESINTLLGQPISVMASDSGVVLNDSVNVVVADVQASNGIVHVIDAVLVPSDENTAEEATASESEAAGSGESTAEESTAEAAPAEETTAEAAPAEESSAETAAPAAEAAAPVQETTAVQNVGTGGQMAMGGQWATAKPTFTICTVERDQSVTIVTSNFPANQQFTVRMRPMYARHSQGYEVGTIDSGQGGSLTATFNIPPELAGYHRIAIRAATNHMWPVMPYFAYNWFYNNTASVCDNVE